MASSIASTFAGVGPSCVRFKQQPSRISAAYATAQPTSAAPIASQTSLYQVLGIPVGATCQEIKAAYRRLARVLHPDVASHNNLNTSSSSSHGEDTSAAADEFMRVHKAYMTLSDPEKRADYDRTLYRRRRQLGSAYVLSATNTGGSAYYTRRTWETDQCW